MYQFLSGAVGIVQDEAAVDDAREELQRARELHDNNNDHPAVREACERYERALVRGSFGRFGLASLWDRIPGAWDFFESQTERRLGGPPC